MADFSIAFSPQDGLKEGFRRSRGWWETGAQRTFLDYDIDFLIHQLERLIEEKLESHSARLGDESQERG